MTFTEAAKVARHRRKMTDELLHAYCCPACHRFHIGQQPLHEKNGRRPRVEIED